MGHEVGAVLCDFFGLQYVKLATNHPDIPSSEHTYLDPLIDNGGAILASTVIWFVLTYISELVSSRLFPEYNKLTFLERKDFDIRVVSVFHAFLTCFHIPLYMVSTSEDFDDFYGFHSDISQYIIIGSLGYFIYDLIVSTRYDMGIAFQIHAVACLFVCYFALYPFLHMQAGYFFGFFEISTIFNHWRGCMELLGKQGSPFHLIGAILFAITFTIFRVVGGTYYSFRWLYGMYSVWAAGNAHSGFVYLYYAVANSTLMLLQYFWFTLIVKAAYELLGGKKEDKKD
uniref:TLC domain-containing protein n=1 Tax=Paramoeba aestuarina TaxID=180227 RepID=A0A7S4KH27_9EUKA|mmetsp:Transcript_18892/g.29637  ORF Transcript_18892/g.29637 Transcript_18892/m.29637 type:complete len:285 (+) Transcript_18892:28-882(+)